MMTKSYLNKPRGGPHLITADAAFAGKKNTHARLAREKDEKRRERERERVSEREMDG